MDTEANVEDLVDRWEVMRDRGAPPTIEEPCAGRPDLAAEVRRIDALRAMESALNTEVCEPRPIAAGRVAGPEGGLPGTLRATAVYRPRRHHDQQGHRI